VTVYDQQNPEHGVLVAQWWARAYENGDLALMATKRSQSLSGFFKMIDAPTILLFECDEQGIWIAGWFEPTFDAAFFSLWVRPDKRSKDALPVLFTMYDMGFRVWPMIMGVTKQERLLRSHERLGYTVVGKIPKFFDGEDAWLVTLTKEDFYSTNERSEAA